VFRILQFLIKDEDFVKPQAVFQEKGRVKLAILARISKFATTFLCKCFF
jgi:hypothetical protein